MQIVLGLDPSPLAFSSPSPPLLMPTRMCLQAHREHHKCFEIGLERELDEVGVCYAASRDMQHSKTRILHMVQKGRAQADREARGRLCCLEY
jgi:hypothetical protein